MNAFTIQNRMQALAETAANGKPVKQSPSVSFGQMLEQSLKRVNQLQQEADASINDLATGKQTDIHQTMIAVSKAEVSFELLMQIRNKVISAYDQIMRTQV